MEMKEIQARSAKFVREYDKKAGRKLGDTSTVMIHLAEEVGELAHQIYNEKSGRDKVDRNNLEEEMADVFLVLSTLAVMYNVDLENVIFKKTERDGKKFGVKL